MTWLIAFGYIAAGLFVGSLVAAMFIDNEGDDDDALTYATAGVLGLLAAAMWPAVILILVVLALAQHWRPVEDELPYRGRRWHNRENDPT